MILPPHGSINAALNSYLPSGSTWQTGSVEIVFVGRGGGKVLGFGIQTNSSLGTETQFHSSLADCVIARTVRKENNGLISSFNGVAEYQPGRHSTAPALFLSRKHGITESTKKIFP